MKQGTPPSPEGCGGVYRVMGIIGALRLWYIYVQARSHYGANGGDRQVVRDNGQVQPGRIRQTIGFLPGWEWYLASLKKSFPQFCFQWVGAGFEPAILGMRGRCLNHSATPTHVMSWCMCVHVFFVFWWECTKSGTLQNNVCNICFIYLHVYWHNIIKETL